jgi:4-amino-4-deoxy-L-arabinose transferase-like glycosyltransferase
MIGWLIAASTSIFGVDEWSIRLVPALLHALTLGLGFALARECFGSDRAGLGAVVAMALIPMMTIGGIAAAPDAPASALWMATALVLARSLARASFEQHSGSRWRAWVDAALVGGLIGLTFLSKYTGLLLIPSALAPLFHPSRRQLLSGPAPWIAAVSCAVVASPVVAWNVSNGWVSVLHRFVWTQHGFGPSLETLGATIGGQALYLGIPMAVGSVWALGRLWRLRERPEAHFLLCFSAIPLAFTYLLCLLSPAAEPHWPAQGYLALAVGLGGLLAEGEGVTGRARGWTLFAVGWAGVIFVALHLVVFTNILPMALGRDRYQARFDLTNELFGWPDVARALRSGGREGEPVAGSHYIICSQIVFALDEISMSDAPRVLCISPEVDDFDLWDRGRAEGEESILYVEDDRFGTPTSEVFPEWNAEVVGVVRLRRGLWEVRSFRLVRVERPGQ